MKKLYVIVPLLVLAVFLVGHRRHAANRAEQATARVAADRNAREAFRGSPHFDYAARYCELYDQNSFDPDFPSLPLEHFEPIVAAFFSRFERIDSLRLPA